MWILEKPSLEQAIEDIKKIIEKSNDKITIKDGAILAYIYRLYNRNGGIISEADNNRCDTIVQNKLYSMYDYCTYKNRGLYYIRKELFNANKVCPMCGYNESSQLDHQMPRSTYKSLSLCRLNLVPLCGVCNNKKHNKDPRMFVHPYYAQFPSGVIFLIVNVCINIREHKMSWKYNFDFRGIKKDLADKIEYQANAIQLIDRLQQMSNTYLLDLFCNQFFTTDIALKSFLQFHLNKCISLYGPNDWRTAFIRALYMSPSLGKEEVENFVNRRRKLVGA